MSSKPKVESKTDSSVTNTTNIEDKRVVADGGIVATEGSTIEADITIESLDAALAGNAIDSVRNVASGAVSGMASVSKATLDFADATNERMAGLASEVASGARDTMDTFLGYQARGQTELLKSTDTSIARMADAFAAASAGESSQLTKTVGTLGLAALVVAGLWVYRKA